MATDLGKAYVQIIPSAKGISGSISKELGGEATSAGKSAGLNIAGAIKGAIAAAGIGTAIKAALDAGGNLQQSFGGLDTLYEDAAEGAKKYAVEAAKAGISANTYAEQAVSFGASLKAAYGNDTTKAMEAANTAILDMADNAAKMGTPIENIQTAYQGFAKGQYQLLDNLKLGYGGTKTEAQRLLADAEKISGVHYDLDNLGDFYDAIHVIQGELGLTGVAADEAKTTFSGSLGAMKAAGENLLANIALGEDITPALNTLGDTVKTFVFSNLIPMLSNIVSALPNLVSGIGSMLIEGLNIVSNNAGDIVKQGLDIVMALVEAIVEAAPYLVEAAFNLAKELGKALIETDWLTIGQDLISSLSDSLSLASGEIFGSDNNFLQGLLDSITANLPEMANKGVEIITTISNGILEAIPSLIVLAGNIIATLGQFLAENAPTLMEAGINLLLNLIDGIITNLPMIIETAATVTAELLATFLANAPKFIMMGVEMLGKLESGLVQAIPKLLAALPKIFTSIKDAFAKYNWKQIGIDLLLGIRDGIIGAIDQVVKAAKEAAGAIWDSVKGFFDINSPSKLMAYAGEMIDAGMAKGITDNKAMVTSAVADLGNSALTDVQISPQTLASEREDRVDELIDLLNNYLPTIASGENNKVVLEGDAGRLFRLMQRESVRNTQLVGVNAVLSAT